MENCKICGKPIDSGHYYKEVADKMEKEQVCFHCLFWIEQNELDKSSERNFAIVNGTHYVLEPHTDTNWLKGFGGHKFYFRFKDGRMEMCDNVWCQGNIPEKFRELMPDNAEFISEAEYLKSL